MRSTGGRLETKNKNVCGGGVRIKIKCGGFTILAITSFMFGTMAPAPAALAAPAALVALAAPAAKTVPWIILIKGGIPVMPILTNDALLYSL